MNRVARLAPSRTTWRWLLALAAGTLVAGAIYAGLPARLQEFLKAALAWLEHLGFWAPVIFVLLYIVLCVVLVPASFLTIGAGAAFGVWKGAVLVSIGATLGATAAFLVSRHLARGWVTRRFGGRPTFIALDRAVAAEGWKIVFLTRLAPVFPFFLMNHLYGLTRVPLRQYVVATWLGIMPGSTLFVYLGWIARQGAQGATTMDWVKWGFFFVTGVFTMIYLAKVARRELARCMEPAGPATAADVQGAAGERGG